MKKRPIFITKSNSITLPKLIREELDLEAGDWLDYIVLQDGTIVLKRMECSEMQALLSISQILITKKER